MATGGCLCGAVRFSVDAEPLAVRACWCRLCQYIGAGNATVNVCYPAEALSFDGAVTWHASVADSGNPMQRGFCPACGTPLFSNSERRPHLTFVRAGTLDDPSTAVPQVTIWAGAAPPWACIDSSIPRHDAQVPPVA